MYRRRRPFAVAAICAVGAICSSVATDGFAAMGGSGAIGLSAAAAASATDLQESVRRYRAAHETRIVGQLEELARFRSVAADPAGLAAAATRLQGWLTERGFESRLLSDGEGPPLVFGSLRTPGARRTVVFYAHYDGQPVTPSQWKTDPFTPVIRSGPLNSGEHEVDWKGGARSAFDPQWRLFARSVSDDKASIIAFLAAFDALEASGRKLTVNVKVAWEGEEERGSPHLAALLKTHHDLLTSDLWLIGDGPVHQSRRPMLYFGARGTIGFQLTVYGPVRALHDGHYGNWVPNPAVMAANLIARMRDDEGAILIPGFAADVRPLTAPELSAIAALPPVEALLRDEFGVDRTEGHEGLPASLMRPALNVRGIRAGQVGQEAANAIPTEAVVSVDLRLVPDQKPAAVKENVAAFLRDQGWTLVAAEPDLAARRAHPRLVKLEWEEGYPALRSDMSSPAAQAVIAAAGRASPEPVALMPMMGGSVPLYLFADTFQVPIIGLPIANHDNNQHAANENLRLQNLWDGIQTYAALMADMKW